MATVQVLLPENVSEGMGKRAVLLTVNDALYKYQKDSFSSHGVSEENFGQLVLIELGLYTARWSQVSASGSFFTGRVVEPRGLGCARRACRQGVVSSSQLSRSLSRVSDRYLVPTQLSLQPAYPPRPRHPASVPSSVVQDETDLIPHPQLQHRGEHVMTVSLPPI